MSFASFFMAVQETEFFTSVRESGLAYPIIMSTHLASIALFGGMIVITDLRLLGMAFTDANAADMIKQLRPFKHAGLFIMLMAGILLFGAKAGTYYDNPYFQIKISLLVLAVVHAMVFRRGIYKNPELDTGLATNGNARLAAWLSLALWIGIMSAGRWIAYFERPEDMPKKRQISSLLYTRPAAPHFDTANHTDGQS